MEFKSLRSIGAYEDRLITGHEEYRTHFSKGIKVYPNPTSDEINIEFGEEMRSRWK